MTYIIIMYIVNTDALIAEQKLTVVLQVDSFTIFSMHLGSSRPKGLQFETKSSVSSHEIICCVIS